MSPRAIRTWRKTSRNIVSAKSSRAALLKIRLSLCLAFRKPFTGISAATFMRDPERKFLDYYLAERSEEHTSELQSRLHLVCRLLLEKKKQQTRSKATP